MRRLQLFEFEDQAWFPNYLRDHMTGVIGLSTSRMRLYEPLVPKLREALSRSGSSEILDLCSGGGGVLPALCRTLRERDAVSVRVTFTDRYPNLRALREVCARAPDQLRFCDQPVDATAVPSGLRGFRTMFSGFHHFGPDEARRIVADAVRQRAGIGIFEFSERARWSLARSTLSPLGVWLLTPRLRPIRWQQWLLAYGIPIVPFTLLWDGVVSSLRTYSCSELAGFTDVPGGTDYVWDIGKLRGNRGWQLPYLIGYPR